MALHLTKERLLGFMVALHVMAFVTAPLLGNKVAHIGKMKFLAGTLLFAFCFLVVDLVNNNWGRKEARRIVTDSVIVRALFYLLFCPMVMALPTLIQPPNFNQFFMQGMRVFLAAEITLWFSQYFVEIPFFGWLRKKLEFGGSYVVSGFLSLAINSTMFSLIAFIGNGQPLVPMIVGQVMFALGMRFLLMPLATAANHVISKME